MKYLKWDINAEGLDPVQSINKEKAHVWPQFRINDTIFGYWVSGTIDLSLYEEFNLIELTVTEILKSALIIDTKATMENDFIQFSTKPEIQIDDSKS